MKTTKSVLRESPQVIRIHKYGSPILRKKARTLREISGVERDIFHDMLKLMYKNGGIGLAAPQVGIDLQMIVIDVGDSPLMIANPKILKRQGSDVMEEGCLSLPDITVKVKRAKRIFVEALNETNKRIRFYADELLARAIQHEADHLKGKLIIDYASISQRLRLRDKLKEIYKKEKDEELRK
jgi:peptide deformylase